MPLPIREKVLREMLRADRLRLPDRVVYRAVQRCGLPGRAQPVIQLTALLGHSCLVLSNVIFVLLLVVILIVASSRPTFNRLATGTCITRNGCA